jgi:hypothetical protein
MSAITIQLPDSIYNAMSDLAKRDGISIDSLFATAAGEKMSAMLGIDFLNERASHASTDAFQRVMAKASKDAPTDPGDEW